MKPVVTDHALLRWLERKHNIDIEFFRQKLAEEVDPFFTPGIRSTTIGDCDYRFAGEALVTVVDRYKSRSLDMAQPHLFPSERAALKSTLRK